ncbi:MAG: signal peptidase [Nocardioidaceae bacterium]|nr:signal peptidase [Nocardioidaceae bacterium]
MNVDVRRRFAPAVLLALAAVLVYLLGTPYADGQFVQKITNATTTAATPMFSCKANVAASAYFAYPLNEASGTVVQDVSGSAHPGTYSATGVTYGTAGPCTRDGARAVTLNGTSGYLWSNAQVSNPQTFTEEVWFNTSTTTGGKLIGFGSQSTTPSLLFDRHVYMTNGATPSGGKLVFGVVPGIVPETITSPNGYNDGTWHLATATLAPSASAQPGMRLYVDGVLVASRPAVTSAQSYAGYWRVGYDNLSGTWPTQPTSSYFAGKVAFAQVYTTALTAAQILSQYGAGKP